MIDDKRSNIDLDDTVDLPVINEQDSNTKTKDPHGIIFSLLMKIGIFLTTVIVVTIITRAIYVTVHKTELTLVDNSRILFIGVNGSGEATYHNAPQKQALTILQTKKKELDSNNQDSSAVSELMNSITCSFSQNDNLSNGMNITYGCSYSKEAAKKAHYSIQTTNRTYTVMGLTDKSQMNPFEDITSNWNQDGLSITNNSDSSIQYSYTYSGDTVTIKAFSNNYDFTSSSINLNLTDVLNDDMKQSIQQIAIDELNTFNNNIIFGKETLYTYSPTFKSIQRNDDDSFTVTLSLSNIYTETLPDYYNFSISYTGNFILNESGSIEFSTSTTHENTYDGFRSDYKVIEKDAS